MPDLFSLILISLIALGSIGTVIFGYGACRYMMVRGVVCRMERGLRTMVIGVIIALAFYAPVMATLAVARWTG